MSSVAAALAEAAAAFGAALAIRSARFTDPAVRSAVTAANIVLSALDLVSDDRGVSVTSSLVPVLEALRISDDREAAQLLVDLSSDLSAMDLARAPERPPLTDSAAIALPQASPASPTPRSQSRQRARIVAGALRDAVRALAFAAYARRAMVAGYATRADATTARAALEALASPLLETGALDGPSFAAVSTIFGLASGHLIDVATSLKPIIRVATKKPLTASLLAWQLYGDTTRAAELVARNGVFMPCFMPEVIEAVAP